VGALHHPHIETNPRNHLAHDINIVPGCHLYKIVGDTPVQVNSLHHQAILDLAPGLTETAHSPDGIIEAVELTDHPFGIGVQWHPEWLMAYQPMQNLFRAFVDAAHKS
jgi:gamma-glutamyl-gamma-aminobutyrate hydrolase PuuD